ncbi:MAG TPA: efflux RND transporter periplasmic adaptor subunit [Pyrinomonadaceae bacterium]|nr:efflux RND transporter periplasmic adaptor subunit [Pyrinomonadaceae bacterium]
MNRAAPAGFDRPPAPVTVAEAAMQDVPVYLDAIGKTVARETVAIQPQVSGRIVKIHFTDGANVRKGDMLFTIDTRPFEASVRQAQAQVAKDVAVKKQAEANQNKDLATAKWDALQVNRYAKLVEAGVVPREQYEQLAAAADSSKAAVEADKAAVHSADESIKADNEAVEKAKVDLSYCYIRSPIDGRAGQRLVDIGNVVNPGSAGGNNAPSNSTASGPPSNALLVIERLDPIYADFTISQNDLARVQAEMHAGTLKTEVRLPETDVMVAGQLTFLDSSVQNQTGQVNLRATVPNSDRQFWPGRFVNIRLVLNTIRGAVLVPATAPQMSAKGSYVYVVKQDNTVDQRQVTLGQRQGDLVVIETGVQPGERVVTQGQVGVTPGGKVRVETPNNNQGTPNQGNNGTK